MRISLIFSTFAYMNTRDNIQAELQVLRMENVSFLEDENKAVEEETRQEYEDKISLMEMECDNAFAKAKEAEKEIQTANLRADKEKMRADNAEQMLGEARMALEESNKRICSIKESEDY